MARSRRRFLGWSAFFGVFAIGWTTSGIVYHDTSLVVSALIFPIPLVACGLWLGLRRGPAVVFDEHAILDGDSGRRVPWEKVERMHVTSDRGTLTESHSLVPTLVHDASSPPRRALMTNKNNPDEVLIDLDNLAMPWTDVVSAVEQASGRPVSLPTHPVWGKLDGARPVDAKARYYRIAFLAVPAASAAGAAAIAAIHKPADPQGALHLVGWTTAVAAIVVLSLSEDRFTGVTRRRRMTCAVIAGLLTGILAAALVAVVAPHAFASQ